MTPQEKAKELVDKYMPYSTGNSNNNTAKQAAIICVEEILNEPAIEFNEYRKAYWQDVKNELNKL